MVNIVRMSIFICVCTCGLQAGVHAKDVGVIAPYRAQVQHLRRLASQQQPLKGLEINTVDQYQGRDKAIILVSFVRSCAGGGSVGVRIFDVVFTNNCFTYYKWQHNFEVFTPLG